MAGSLIDASLRRATLLAEARGFVVPDSKPVLEPAPQIIIEGDDEDVFLDFTDGLGYTTDKNAYKNYGYKFIWVHDGKVQNSASSQSITNDLDNGDQGSLPIFNEETGKYEPIIPRGVACITIEKPTNRNYILILELPFDIFITETSFSIESGSADVDFPEGEVGEGNVLDVDVSGTSGTSSFLSIQITFDIRMN